MTPQFVGYLCMKPNLRQMYEEINEELFGGILPLDIPVCWDRNLRVTAGYVKSRRNGNSFVIKFVGISDKLFRAHSYDKSLIKKNSYS